MRMGFRDFLLARDDLGTPFSVTYKGSDTFPTIIGSLCTLGVKALVISQCIMLFISMVEMQEPMIRSYERPVYRTEEGAERLVSADDEFCNIGLLFRSHHLRSRILIPESVGRFMLETTETPPDSEIIKSRSPLVNCTEESFKHVDPTELEHYEKDVQFAYCADSSALKLRGVNTFSLHTF